MSADEHAIRELVATWMSATKAGDLAYLCETAGRRQLSRDANLLSPVSVQP